jgi:molybdenum cofactor cytidylyltransferase
MAAILAQSSQPDYDGRVIPAIILAAGKSTRMGRLKAALPVSDTETFLTQLVRTFHAAGVEYVTVVLGYEAARLRTDLSRVGLAPHLVVNDRFEAGQLSSLLAGLEAVDGPQVEAILMMLVDAPLVSAETVRAVLERYQATRAPIVRPVRGAEHGHPVLIDRSLFGALRAASPASGAKPIVRAHVSAAGDVPVDDAGAFMDIDTPEDYEKIRSQARSG